MTSNRWIFGIALSVSLIAAVATTLRLSAAASSHRSESARLESLEADIAKLNRLRVAEAHAQSGEPPEDDLLGSVRETIRDAGLPSDAFARLSTSGESAVRGREGYARKAYRLELNGLDATYLGSFLSLWRSSEPLWTVDSIELRRQQSSRRARSRAQSGYAVSMSLSTVYANGLGSTGGSRP